MGFVAKKKLHLSRLANADRHYSYGSHREREDASFAARKRGCILRDSPMPTGIIAMGFVAKEKMHLSRRGREDASISIATRQCPQAL